MSKSQTTPSFPGVRQDLVKHAFLALLTGGLSLVWLVARNLPGLWDRVCVERADWIKWGKAPLEGRWLAQGWLAVFGTIIVSIPAALVIGSLGSLAFHRQVHFPGQRIQLPDLLLVLLLMATVFAMFGLVCIWLWHTIRWLAAYAVERFKIAFAHRSL